MSPTSLGRVIKSMGAQVTLTTFTAGVEDQDHGDITPVPASTTPYATHDRLKEPIAIDTERGQTVTVNSIFHVDEGDAPSAAALSADDRPTITDDLGDVYQVEASGPPDELGTRRLYCSKMGST